MKTSTFIIVFLLLILFSVLVAGFFIGTHLLLGKALIFVKVHTENIMDKTLEINRANYIPFKGVKINGITLYKDKSKSEKIIYISRAYIQFPIIPLITKKMFSPLITFSGVEIADITASGSFGLSISIEPLSGGPSTFLSALSEISIRSLSLTSKRFSLRNMTGNITVDPVLIKAEKMDFIINGVPCSLSFSIFDPVKKKGLELSLFSKEINANLKIEKTEDAYKISSLKGTFRNSSFDFMGEVPLAIFDGADESNATQEITLYGKTDIDFADIALFIRDDKGKSFIDIVKPEGKLKNAVYFKRAIGKDASYELGIKMDAENLKVWRAAIDKFHTEIRVKNDLIEVPVVKVNLYGGIIFSTTFVNLGDKYKPYEIKCRMTNIDIARILKETDLGKRNIRGLVSSEFLLKGDASNLSTTEGHGRIVVNNANLGPMPILTPLLGNIYGYFQRLMPDLKKIDITKGSCDFYVTNRKVVTENLTLWGDIVSLHAKGYIDFDKNLNFEVENEVLEPESVEGGDWQVQMQQLVVQFGKLISKAYLKGTLQNPKWTFEYFGGVKNVFGGGFDRVLKNIFE